MEQTIETPDGGHYEKCGEMQHADESNRILHVTKCSECGETRIQSGFLTDMAVLIGTTMTAFTFVTGEWTVGPNATEAMATVWPAMGFILAALTIVVGGWLC